MNKYLSTFSVEQEDTAKQWNQNNKGNFKHRSFHMLLQYVETTGRYVNKIYGVT